MSKFLKIILPIVVVIFLVAGYLYLAGKAKLSDEPVEKNIRTTQEKEKTETKTTDWKTYKNEEYGFELRHPINLKVNHSDIKGRSVVVDGDNFIINISPVKFIKALNVKNICYMADIGNTRILEKTEVNETNMPLCIDDSQKETMVFYRILIPKNKNQTTSSTGDYFEIEAQIYGNSNTQDRLNIFKKILSTFKFTK